VRLRFLQHMVTCCCGGQGVGERQRGHAAAAKDCPKHVELLL